MYIVTCITRHGYIMPFHSIQSENVSEFHYFHSFHTFLLIEIGSYTAHKTRPLRMGNSFRVLQTFLIYFVYLVEQFSR